MKNLLLIFTLCFAPFFTSAQINYSIKGKLLSQDEYLPSGNIFVLNPQDSSLITGNFFMDGVFEVNDLKEEKVLVQLSSLEFDDTFIEVKFTGQAIIDLGEIPVQKSDLALDEIVVTSRRPIYNQKADGTVEVFVQNTSLAESNSTREILSKSPDVIIDEEDGIAVFGKGSAILYMNGKRITPNQLSIISPSNIKKIEIIRNPSVKYDADGGAVIHIKTIKNTGEGYLVKLKQNLTYSKFAGLNTFSDVNVTLNKNRFSSHAYYNILTGDDRHILHTTRKRADEAIFLSTDLTTEWRYQYDNFSNYGLGAQYDMKDNSYLSLEYSGTFEKEGGNTLSNNEIIDNESTNFYKSDINRNEIQKNNSLSLNYQKSLDTLGSTLFLGGQYSNFSRNNDNPILEESLENNDNLSRSLKNIFELNIDIFSGQVDYGKALNDKNTLELGVKYSYVGNGSGLDFLIADEDSNFYLNETLSNQFNYNEAVGAAYLSFKSKLTEKINYTLGLRTEYTDYDLVLSAQENPIQDSYFNFFPNFTSSIKLNKDYQLGFSYTSRINRPSYQRLNPVLIYQDPYTSIQGNPEIKPEVVHGFEINNKLKKLTVKLGYNHYINPMGGGAIRGDDDKSYILKRFNFDRKQILFSSISRSFENKWWTSMNTLNIKYTSIDESTYNFEKLDFRPNFYFYSNNRFTLNKLFNMEVLFWYLGQNNDGVYRRYNSYNLAFTVDKSFFDDALKIRLTANDLLKTVRAAGDYVVGPTDIFFARRWNTDYFRASITYEFGKIKKGAFKNKAVGEAERGRAR